MKFFLDTADVSEIKALKEYGLVDGVTTNPSLIKKSGQNIYEVLKEICEIVEGPVSAEVVATEASKMVDEAVELSNISKHIVIKLPLTMEGIKAGHQLQSVNKDEQRITTGYTTRTNFTLCFSTAQAILAAKAEATYVSPFVGRLDDIGQEGMQLINEIVDVYRAQEFTTQVLVASIRHPVHVVHAARLGAHVVTLPPNVLRALFNHPLTDSGLESFLADWEDSGQKI